MTSYIAIHIAIYSVAVSSYHQSATDSDPTHLPQTSNSFVFSRLSKSDVLHQLCCLDPCIFVGPDGISAQLLREVATEIAMPLTLISISHFQMGMFHMNGNVLMLH